MRRGAGRGGRILVGNGARSIHSGNHAREWPAFHLAIYFIDLLLSGYEKDPIITRYIQRLNFFIFPVLNPDGFIFSRTSKRDTVGRID